MPDVSDVVPPGGDVPVDQQLDFQLAARRPSPPPARLPVVPRDVPTDVQSPPDWRTLGDESGAVPPGYQTPGGTPVYSSLRADRWGVWSCVVGSLGLVQAGLVRVPLLPVIAISLALSGLRYSRLDPAAYGPGHRKLTPSVAGVFIGSAGVILALVTWAITRSLSGLSI